MVLPYSSLNTDVYFLGIVDNVLHKERLVSVKTVFDKATIKSSKDEILRYKSIYNLTSPDAEWKFKKLLPLNLVN